MTEPSWQDVPQSSNIARVHHDGSGMVVEFRNGGVYHYAGVPPDAVLSLTSSPSPGKYLLGQLVPAYGQGKKL
jgi:hypothetical protein